MSRAVEQILNFQSFKLEKKDPMQRSGPIFRALSTIIHFGRRQTLQRDELSREPSQLLESDRTVTSFSSAQRRRPWLRMVLEEEEENMPLRPLKPVGGDEETRRERSSFGSCHLPLEPEQTQLHTSVAASRSPQLINMATSRFKKENL